MEYFDRAKDMYNAAVKAVSKTETEKKLSEAMSNENWGASTSLMREISNLTYDWSEYSVVMSAVFETLGSQPRCWRQIFKALSLLEYLLKNGAEKCIQDARDRLHLIRSLTGFSYFSDGGEKGAGVREKAKQVVTLLGDEEMLQEEREKSRQLRDKYTGIGRDGVLRGAATTVDRPMDSKFGGSGGRYNDDSSAQNDVFKSKKKDKKKKDKEKKKAHKHHSDSDDDFDFDETPTKSKGKKDDDDFGKFDSGDDDFAHFDDSEEEEVKPKKEKKSKKKSKEKKSKPKLSNADSDEEFGNFEDFHGASASNNDTFDPFGASQAAPPPQARSQALSDDFGDFSAAPQAKVPAPAPSSNDPFGDDLFGGMSNAPAPRQQQQPMMMQQHQQPMMMQQHQQPMMMQQHQQPMMMQQQPMMMQQQPMMMQQQPMMMQQQPMMMQQQPMMMQQQPMMMQQQNNTKSSQGNDPWAGLVDLQKLSINSNGNGNNAGRAVRSPSGGTASNQKTMAQKPSSDDFFGF